MSSRRNFLMGMCLENFTLTNFPYLYYSLVNGRKAKLLEIAGNGEVENQLAYELEDTYWSYSNASGSFANGIATFTATALYGYLTNKTSYRENIIAGHIYLAFAYVKLTSATTSVDLILGNSGGYVSQSTTATTSWQLVVKQFTSSITNTCQIMVRDNRASGWDSIQVQCVQLVDLTIREGTGNEPTSLTDNRIKKIIADGYKPKNSGTYKASVVESVDTRGFNLFDEIVGNGFYSTTDGSFNQNNNYRCSANKIRVQGNETYYFYASTSIIVMQYDKDNQLIKGWSSSDNGNYISIQNATLKVQSNCAYVVWWKTTTDTPKVCINRSSSLNGTYKAFESFNLFNGVGVDNHYIGANGVEQTNNDWARTDYIAINGGETFFTNANVNAQTIVYSFFDSTKTFIEGSTSNNATAPSNAKYLIVNTKKTLLALKDLCVNISDPKKNGTYLPYGILDRIKLPAPLQLGGAINAHDTFKVESDRYVFTRTVWTKTYTNSNTWNSDTYDRYYNTELNGIAEGIEGSEIADLLHDTKYTLVSRNNNPSTDNSLCMGYSGILIIRQTNTNASSIQSYMAGKTIWYKMKTPQVINIPKRHLKAVRIDTLSVVYESTYNRFRFDPPTNIKYAIDNSQLGNIYCSAYMTRVASSSQSGNGIAIGASQSVGLLIYDDTCHTTTELLNKIGNAYLFYETENEVQDFVNVEAIENGGTITTSEFDWVENQLCPEIASPMIVQGVNNTITYETNKATMTLTANQSGLIQFYKKKTTDNTIVAQNSYLQLAYITSSRAVSVQLRTFPRIAGQVFALEANKRTLCAFIQTSGSLSGDYEFGIIIDDSQNLQSGDTITIEKLELVNLNVGFPNGDIPTSINDWRIQYIIEHGYIPTNTSGTYKVVNSETLPNLTMRVQK